MIQNLKRYLKRESIIQLTLLKITFSIFSFLIIFLLLYGRDYWQKETLKVNYQLLSTASNVQLKLQSQINEIDVVNQNAYLTPQERLFQIEAITKPIFDAYPNDIVVGFYDINLKALITKNGLEPAIKKKILPIIGLDNTFHNFSWNNANLVVISLPIYKDNHLMGYAWAFTNDGFSLFASYRKVNGVLVLTLGLSALIILAIRKYIKQIGFYLNEFVKIIMAKDFKEEQEKEEEEILAKLPELQPVLFKIRTFTDELKHMNIQLELSELKMVKILEGISDGFFSLDRSWQFTFVNSETQKLLQTEGQTLLGRQIWDVFPQVVTTVTGHNLQKAMSENESIHWEAPALTAPERYYDYHAYPFKEGLTVFFRDITESKRQHAELARLEKLNLIGQLAAGISHEIRNPLTTVRGFLQLQQAKAKNDHENYGYMDLMISEIDRANTIITDFLSLAKADLDNTKTSNINDIIQKLFPILQADAYNSNKEIVLDLNALAEIMLNENEIRQLLLNLVRNGLEATPEHGKVTIRTYQKAEKVVLAIQDQGSGIPKEIQEKIGTPFFTTKQTGTGLGLAISMGIAQRHKAMFEFETGNGGTTFYISFPIP